MSTTNNHHVDASIAPFITQFTHAIILRLAGKKFITNKKESVIHTDIIPHIEDQTLKQSILYRERYTPISTPYYAPTKTMMPRQLTRTATTQTPIPPKPTKKPTIKKVNKITITTNEQQKENAWNKITPLLNDQTITMIECQGANRPLMVTRIGQKQPTRNKLTEKEIQEVFDTISQKTHIPLLEGTFKAALENYSIHAMISEIKGSRFIIKKAGFTS
jgi:hypothetical protein